MSFHRASGALKKVFNGLAIHGIRTSTYRSARCLGRVASSAVAGRASSREREKAARILVRATREYFLFMTSILKVSIYAQ